MRRTFTALVLLGLSGIAVAVLPSASASAVPDSTPALVATGADALSLVWRGTTPRRLHQQSSARGRWTATAELSGPASVAETSGVGRGADPRTGRVLTAAVAREQVWVRTGDSPWSALGGAAAGAPAVAGLGGDSFAVVVRGDDGTVKVRYLTAGAWSGWTSLGGTFSTSPAVAVRDGSLVVAAAQKNRLVRTAVVSAGGRSGGWRASGVLSTATPGLAAEPGTGILHLITRNPDLTAADRMSGDGGLTWGRPTRLSGRLDSGIAATSRSSGTVDIAALNLDGAVVQNTYQNGRWGPFRKVIETRTTVLADDAVTAVTGDPAGTRTITLAASAALPRPGEILAATSTPVTPDGLLVKVTAVAGRTVTAVPAKLTEAVPEGTIDQSFTLGAAEGPLTQPVDRRLPCDRGAKAGITGSVSVAPRFDLSAHWSPAGGADAAAFTGALTQQTQLKTTISGGATCKLARTALLDRPLRFTPAVVMVGSVPVVLTPEVQFHLQAEASVQAPLTMAAGQTSTVRAGLTYRAGAVQPVSTLTSRFTYDSPSVTRTGSAQVTVSPVFSFRVYGVPGPQLTTSAHVRIGGDASRPPKWVLSAGLGAGVQLVLPQLAVKYGRDDVLAFEKALTTVRAAGSTTPAVRTSIAVARTTARVGDRITLTGRVVRDDGTPVAAEDVTLQWASPRRPGTGQAISLRTTADGTWATTVTADEKGRHSFTVLFPGAPDAPATSTASVAVTVT